MIKSSIKDQCTLWYVFDIFTRPQGNTSEYKLKTETSTKLYNQSNAISTDCCVQHVVNYCSLTWLWKKLLPVHGTYKGYFIQPVKCNIDWLLYATCCKLSFINMVVDEETVTTSW